MSVVSTAEIFDPQVHFGPLPNHITFNGMRRLIGQGDASMASIGPRH